MKASDDYQLLSLYRRLHRGGIRPLECFCGYLKFLTLWHLNLTHLSDGQNQPQHKQDLDLIIQWQPTYEHAVK